MLKCVSALNTLYLCKVSRTTLRIVIILAAISIVGITVTQLYWVRRALDIRENQFNRDVNTALRNVATKIFEINQTPSPANNPVTQVSTNYFVVAINDNIDVSLLEFLLITEFEKRNIAADFEYGIYDCSDQCMVYGNYISPTATRQLVKSQTLPEWKEEGYYFGVQFPLLQANLISQMGIWGFSSVVLLVVIFFFIYTLFVILKQRRLSEVQQDFINNMTHEFKTPISTIAISSEVLKSPDIAKSPERLMKYATIIENENNRLKQQVERVLQMARLDEKRIELERESVNIHDLIDESISNCILALEEKHGNINSKFEALSSQVFVDKLHMTNVFTNLIDNATKYNINRPEVTIKSENIAGKIVIQIEDNGIGISPENHKKVFHRFFRVSTGDIHDVKGFGLGLSYVKLIIESHGGSINLKSNKGQGSVFTITLPIA